MPSSEVMHKFKHGQLHSGSKKGPEVKSRAQAIAIMLSEKRAEGQHGGKYPEKQMGGPVGMPPMPPGMGGMVPQPGLGGPMPQGLPSSMSPMMQGFRADGGNVLRFPGRSALLDKELSQSPDQVAQNRTNRILSQVLQRPNVLPIGPSDDDKAYGGGVGGYQFGGSPTGMGLTPGFIERQEARNISRAGMPHLGPIMSTVGGRTDNHAISVPSGSYVLPAAHVSALGQGNSLNGMKVLQGMFGPSMSSPPPGVSPMKAMHSPALRPPPMPHALPRPSIMAADGGNATFKQRFPASVLAPLGVKDEGPSMDSAFSNVNDEYPLGSALRAKAAKMGNSGSSSGGSRGDAHVGKPVPIMAAGGEYVLSPQQVMRGPLKNPWNMSLDDGHAVLDHWVKKTHKKYAKTVANLPPPAKT
jgi:hypothetical protein